MELRYKFQYQIENQIFFSTKDSLFLLEQNLKPKELKIENEIIEMRSEIKELKNTIKELVKMMKAVYEFEDVA